jgi:hypothetical protein
VFITNHTIRDPRKVSLEPWSFPDHQLPNRNIAAWKNAPPLLELAGFGLDGRSISHLPALIALMNSLMGLVAETSYLGYLTC